MLPMMLDGFLRKLTSRQAEKNSSDPLQLAFAALLVEAARADEDYSEKEAAIIDRALARKFSLDAGAAATLRAEAEAAQARATDVQRFTRIAKEMNAEEKIALIEDLWSIVLADGSRDPFEDTLIRQICGLIYVDDKDSGAARAQVAARLQQNRTQP
ncbi:MAG: TerB family tellurite resistance protein [Parvularculaceae bacterium]